MQQVETRDAARGPAMHRPFPPRPSHREGSGPACQRASWRAAEGQGRVLAPALEEGGRACCCSRRVNRMRLRVIQQTESYRAKDRTGVLQPQETD